MKGGDSPREQVAGLGISNQRDSAVWDRTDGHPLTQMPLCGSVPGAKDICARVEESGKAEWVRHYKQEINLSPYFPASKLAWFMESDKGGRPQKASRGNSFAGDHRQLPGLPADRRSIL